MYFIHFSDSFYYFPFMEIFLDLLFMLLFIVSARE